MSEPREWSVILTRDDLRFVQRARQHYQVFAEVSDKQGESRTAGIFRAQEFHAQQMQGRIEAAIVEPSEAPGEPSQGEER